MYPLNLNRRSTPEIINIGNFILKNSGIIKRGDMIPTNPSVTEGIKYFLFEKINLKLKNFFIFYRRS